MSFFLVSHKVFIKSYSKCLCVVCIREYCILNRNVRRYLYFITDFAYDCIIVKLLPTTDPVSLLFNDNSLLRTLRYLLANGDKTLSSKEIADYTKLKSSDLKKVLTILTTVNVAKESKRKTGKAYKVNTSSVLVEPLRSLLQFDYQSNKSDLARQFRALKGIKKVILSGQVTGNNRSEVDMVIVGDNVVEKKLLQLLELLNYKTGYELRYILLKNEEFQYRIDMNDRMIRNVIDFDHFVILGKL